VTGLSLHNTHQSEAERVQARQKFLGHQVEHHFSDEELEKIGKKNCQNLVGAITIPLGIAGPVLVQTTTISHDTSNSFLKEDEQDEYFLPLATTEGALVASIQRGCKAISSTGGTSVLVEQRGMTRAPVFECRDGRSAVLFLDWAKRQTELFVQAAKDTSIHMTFLDVQGWVEGRFVFLRYRFDTDQAMGMNMTTIATQKAWNAMNEKLKLEDKNFGVTLVSLSGNLCTDKKQATINTLLGRGWWVQAEVLLSDTVLETVLKTTTEKFFKVHHAKNLIGSHLAGGAAQNMQIANAAAAILIATGQDATHVVDVSQGTTIVERSERGLYVSVTLPTVPVGVVGGGTWLLTQKAARTLMMKDQKDGPSSAQLAAAVGVAALAAEVSGIAALSSHDLAKAHQQLGRESR
jgi:hydroxymethylglutaryl-CoA reductase (NADPH)